MSDAPTEARGVPEQRGDFMLLPPLTPTFGTPALIQQLPKEFLVTRRPLAVSTEPVGHTIDSALIGRVPGRARRRMRFPAEELEHLVAPLDDVEDEEPAPQVAPQRSEARARAVARPRSSPTPPLPTRSDVRRSVTSPPPAARPSSTAGSTRQPVSTPETIPGELVAPPMPPSTFPGVGDSSSVVRRRGGAAPALPASQTSEPLSPPAPSDVSDADEVIPAHTAAAEPDTTSNRAPSRGVGASDTPPLQRRRSRGRVTTPILPDDDDEDIPPAVKKMLEELDDVSMETPGSAISPPRVTPEATELAHRVGSTTDASSNGGAREQRSSQMERESIPASPESAVAPTPTAPASPAPDSSTVSELREEPALSPGVSDTVSASTRSSRASVEDTAGVDAALLTHRTPPVAEPSATSVPLASASVERSPSGVSSSTGGSSPAPASAPSPPGPVALPQPGTGPGIDVGAIGEAPATSLRATTLGTSIAATDPVRQEKARAQIRPVLAGRTGIQRRARSRPAPGGTSRDTMSRGASGLAGITGTPTPNVAGPRRVEVPEQVRQALRSSVGEPPTHVTVHEGSRAAEETGAVNAEAFTRDGQIFLAGDAPLSSARGQELLAHELTHVMQQGGRNGSMPGEHTREGQDLEAGALAVEKAMAAGAHETIAPKAIARPSRDPEAPELHHRHDVGTREASRQSSWTPSPPPPPRPQEMVFPQALDVSPDIQRRERDMRSSALSRGLGAIGSTLEHGLMSNIEQETLGPPAATKDKDSRYKRLERQAADLYPYIRARLRAELVRDRERRGRIARDWN